MNKKKKKSNNKNKIIDLIFTICIVAIIIYILYTVVKLIITPTNITVIENGTVSQEETAIGYIIRDEKIAKGNNTENGMVQIKSEGEKVAGGNSIFRYFSKNEEEISKKIEELNIEIQEALLGQTDLFNSDIKAIENQIENKIDGLKNKNSIQDINEYKKDISTYIIKKAKIAGELSKSGSYINNLIQEREKLQLDLDSNSEYITAPMSGTVSYRVDDLEETLTVSNIDGLNKEMLENLNLKTGQVVATSNEIGKIVNNYECYIATLLNSQEAKEAKINQKVTIVLSTQDEITGRIDYIKEQEDGTFLIVFRINECVEKLIDYRKISFDIIWWKYDGLKVPKSAIVYDNGLSYVIRNRGGYYNKILVEVLKENSNFCIVDNYSNDKLKELGFSTEEINNIRKISIYDEILIDGKLENME